MTRHWEPGCSYAAGEEVEYQGQRYRVIQGHTSQSDWAPGTATAALFGHLDSIENRGPSTQPDKPCYEHPQVPPQAKDTLDPLRNTIAPQIGSLGGRDGWLHDARRRTDELSQTGFRAPTSWVLANGREIPHNAIEAGKEGDNALYVARAYVEDGLYVGKAGKHLSQGAEIGRQHKTYSYREYEVLIGDPRAVRWVETNGMPDPQKIGRRHVDAGLDVHGHQIFIAQVNHNGGIHPARADTGASGAYLAYGDHELAFQEYRVLCYA